MNVQRRKLLKAGFASCAALMCSPLAVAKDLLNLKIVHNQEFAPFEYFDGHQAVGILPEILDFIFLNIEGVDLFHEPLPWRRAQALVLNSHADAMVAFKSNQRLKYLYFNERPLLTLKPCLCFSATHPKLDDLKKISSFDDLKNFDVVDLMGNHWAEQTVQPHAPIKWFPHFTQVLKVILSNRYDVHVALSHEMMNWHLHQLGYEKKRLISHHIAELPSEIPVYLGLRKDLANAREILSQVDAVLEGSEDQLQKIKAQYIFT
ncbi:MAG: transporter substrate-binding domain-containing protein [Methylocystaceae bacterium]|nr:transporter substrate-binding domain-containing protein [Methylocystaceae bacterium]